MDHHHNHNHNHNHGHHHAVAKQKSSLSSKANKQTPISPTQSRTKGSRIKGKRNYES